MLLTDYSTKSLKSLTHQEFKTVSSTVFSPWASLCPLVDELSAQKSRTSLKKKITKVKLVAIWRCIYQHVWTLFRIVLRNFRHFQLAKTAVKSHCGHLRSTSNQMFVTFSLHYILAGDNPVCNEYWHPWTNQFKWGVNDPSKWNFHKCSSIILRLFLKAWGELRPPTFGHVAYGWYIVTKFHTSRIRLRLDWSTRET